MNNKTIEKKNHPYLLRNINLLTIPEHNTLNITMLGDSQYTNTNTPADIFNAPDAIKDLPKFDGNPRLLFEFINNVEEILALVQQSDSRPQGKIFLKAIRNKIEGEANEVLYMYGTQLNCDGIKNNIILHYSDKRTETSLIRDLHLLQQEIKTVEQFYSEVIELLSALVNNIRIHETDTNVISSKKHSSPRCV